VAEAHIWDDASGDGVHIWRTLDFRRADAPEGGGVAVEWDAPAAYTFPTGERRIVHGGMIATLLDTAMGMVCVESTGPETSFLTADLSVEFYRSAEAGQLRAEAEVVYQSRRAAFCYARVYDAERTLLASARCTQILRPRSA